jgi:hypothetical protein
MGREEPSWLVLARWGSATRGRVGGTGRPRKVGLRSRGGAYPEFYLAWSLPFPGDSEHEDFGGFSLVVAAG